MGSEMCIRDSFKDSESRDQYFLKGDVAFGDAARHATETRLGIWSNANELTNDCAKVFGLELIRYAKENDLCLVPDPPIDISLVVQHCPMFKYLFKLWRRVPEHEFKVYESVLMNTDPPPSLPALEAHNKVILQRSHELVYHEIVEWNDAQLHPKIREALKKTALKRTDNYSFSSVYEHFDLARDNKSSLADKLANAIHLIAGWPLEVRSPEAPRNIFRTFVSYLAKACGLSVEAAKDDGALFIALDYLEERGFEEVRSVAITLGLIEGVPGE